MVRKGALGVFFFIMLFIGFASACTGDSSDIIMRLYQESNSHVSLWNVADKGYDVLICYSDIFGGKWKQGPSNKVHECNDDFNSPIGYLSKTYNSHFSNVESSTYNIPICYGNLTCNYVYGNCGDDMKAVARLYNHLNRNPADRLSNTHVSLASYDGPGYDWKVCCNDPGLSGSSTTTDDVAKEIYWEDTQLNQIPDADLGDTVAMVFENANEFGFNNGDSVNFSIYEGDWASPDDPIRADDSDAAGPAIIGTVVGVKAIGFWTITKEDMDLMEDFGRSNYNQILFMVNNSDSFKSGYLKISSVRNDTDGEIEIVSPPCGFNYSVGYSVPIKLKVSDPDSEVTGNVTINGVHFSDFSNFPPTGSDEIDLGTKKFTEAGNVMIEVSANDSNGNRQVIVSSIMIIGDDYGSYVAACIDKPKFLSRIESGRDVNFSAQSTRGIVKNSSGTFEVDKAGINFFWKFSSGNNPYTDGANPLAYNFYKTFQVPGRNWATLEVEVKDHPKVSSRIGD